MNIHPFIFNWNRQFEKSCAIEDAVKPIFEKVTVINSDGNNTRDGWIDIGDESYFGDQFRKALELFESGLVNIQPINCLENAKRFSKETFKKSFKDV